MNIGVTTSLLAEQRSAAALISYGGSNLVACLFGIGFSLNIYRQGVVEPRRRTTRPCRSA